MKHPAVVILVVLGSLSSAAGASLAASAESTSSPVEGTWKTSYTQADFVRAGATPDELGNHSENWGSFVLSFHAGAWTGRKTDAPRGRGDHGTYTLKGNIISLRRGWAYRWSVVGNILRLRKTVKHEPTGFTAKAWTRVP
jgi:hypothetical protein